MGIDFTKANITTDLDIVKNNPNYKHVDGQFKHYLKEACRKLKSWEKLIIVIPNVEITNCYSIQGISIKGHIFMYTILCGDDLKLAIKWFKNKYPGLYVINTIHVNDLAFL